MGCSGVMAPRKSIPLQHSRVVLELRRPFRVVVAEVGIELGVHFQSSAWSPAVVQDAVAFGTAVKKTNLSL